MSIRLTLARVSVAAVAATVAVAGLIGYAAADATTATPTAVTAPAAPQSPDQATAKSFGIRLAGALDDRGPVSRAKLQALKQHRLKASFITKMGKQPHTFTGPLLIDVLKAADPAFNPDEREDFRRFVILVQATDGYQVALSWGEIEPLLEGKGVIVALTADGNKLERPRLAVPGDSHGARYVYNLSKITLLRLSSGLARGSAASASTGSGGIHLGGH